MTELQLDVAVVNFNSGAWLSRCLSSLLHQKVLLRITVVDNASSDTSLSDAAAFTSQVTVIRNNRNIGFGAAVNQALADSKAPYVLVINPDCEVQAGALSHLIKALDDDLSVGIAGPLVINADGSEQRANRRRTPTARRSLVTALGLEALGLEGVNVRGQLPSEPTRLSAVSGAALMIRRDCWLGLAGYDTGYFLHCEDLDLFRRAQQQDWKIMLVPAARVVHGKGVSHSGHQLVAERHKLAGMLRYYAKFEAAKTPWWMRSLWPLAVRLRYCLRWPVLALRQRASR